MLILWSLKVFNNQSMSIGCVGKLGHLSGFLRHYLLNTADVGPSINYVTPKGGRGGLTKRYHWIFLLFKSIRILTESVTWGEGGSKIANFGVT